MIINLDTSKIKKTRTKKVLKTHSLNNCVKLLIHGVIPFDADQVSEKTINDAIVNSEDITKKIVIKKEIL